MITFIEYTDFSLLTEELSQTCGFNFLQYLTTKKLPVKKFNIENWSDLQEIVSESEGFFSQETDQNYLVNFGNLKLDKKTLEYLKSFDSKEIKLYYYTAEIDGISSDIKKIIKGTFQLLTLKKPDAKIILEIAKNYLQSLDLTLSENELLNLIKGVLSYQEIIDNLDFVDLAEDKKQALQSLYRKEELPVFMYSFRADKAKEDAGKWYKKITEDDLQLGLSLIFSKLEKQNSTTSKTLQRELIYTDEKIKTTSGVSPLIWWKLFLWKAAKS